MIFVPAKFAKAAVVEAIEAEIPLAVVITEGVPVKDTRRVLRAVPGLQTRLIGPNCPGSSRPDSPTPGSSRPTSPQAGRIGLVSKSGTLTTR